MRSIAIVVGLWLLPGVALAANTQSSAPDAVVDGTSVMTEGPIPYGIASRSFLTLSAWNAQPIDTSVTFAFSNFPGGQGINRTGGSSFFKVPIQLPNGAAVSEIELAYCDTGASNIAAHWFRQPKNGPVVTITNVVTSVGTPGCTVTSGTITPTQTIDNDANSYNIELFMGAPDATVAFLSARVGYRLQISPAPATATFPTDVPTSHPFFRFVEALAASGVTGGCGAGTYCPDSPVTRGQMAVFLATALGLHWPN